MISLVRSIFAPPRHLVLLVAALWIGLALVERRSERQDISKETLNNIVFYGLLSYILGGRLLYALTNFSVFVQSPISLFSLNLDLFDPFAALASAVIVGYMYAYRQKLSLWRLLDALTPLFAALAIGISLFHLAAGTAFGSLTNLPWGINLWNATRHPSQIYELIASLLVFCLLWFRKTASLAGSTFLQFAALMAGTRLFLEAFRGDSTLIWGGLRLAQILAWFVLALTLFISEWFHRAEMAN